MALAIDGTAVSATGTTSLTQALPALTTTHAGDIVIVVATMNGSYVLSVSDTANLSWALRGGIGAVGNDIEIWWAVAPYRLTSDIITVTMQATPSFNGITAFAVSGASLPNPWDTNPVLPVTSNGSTAIAVSTSAPNAMIIGAYGQSNSTTTAGANFTLITGVDFLLLEYAIPGAPQSNLTIPIGSSSGIVSCLGDALMPVVAWSPSAVSF